MADLYGSAQALDPIANQWRFGGHPARLKVTMCNMRDDVRHRSPTSATVRTATWATDLPVQIVVFVGNLEPASGLEPPTC